jgi:uncharacterized protein DUF6879
VLTREAFGDLFRSAERSVMRLENRRRTDMADERDELRAFLAGTLPDPYPWERTWWTDMVARHVEAGRAFRRVRVVEDSLTDYNRYMIYTGSWNVTAGEDLRYLARAEANRLDLPDHDFWVFDSVRLCELRFTGDGRPLPHDLITDPDIVARHEEWILRALGAATRSADYVAEDPTRAWPPIRLMAASRGS